MDSTLLLDPLLWFIVALFVLVWKAGTWMQNIHAENVRAKQGKRQGAE